MLSRRDFIGTAMLGGVAGVRIAQNVAPDDGELALVNGRIYTFDDQNRIVNSVLIRNGRFAAADQSAQSAKRVIDLQGRTVIPGLIDNHTHFVRIGNLPGYDARALESALSVSAAQKVIAARSTGVRGV